MSFAVCPRHTANYQIPVVTHLNGLHEIKQQGEDDMETTELHALKVDLKHLSAQSK